MASGKRRNDRRGPAWESFEREETGGAGRQSKWQWYKRGFTAGLLLGKEMREDDYGGQVPAR